MKIIKSQEKLSKQGFTIFLAGPTPRSNETQSWRPDAVDIFNKYGFEGTLILPEFDKIIYEFEYDEQILWEHEAMTLSDVVMFWIPRDIEGGMPAFTTNIEFGYMLSSNPNKMYVGGPKNADNNRYIEFMCNKENIGYSYELEDLIKKILNKNRSLDDKSRNTKRD